MKAFLWACMLGLAPAMTLAASHDLETFIEEYDLDRDGSVSKEEFAKERERRFTATDADHDGSLTRDEYVNEYKSRLALSKPDEKKFEKQMKQTDVRFKALDANQDGKISPAEFQHSGWSMFSHHDRAKDGAISAKDAVKDVKDVKSATKAADAT